MGPHQEQGHMGAAPLGTHPAFAGKPAARLEGAQASGGAWWSLSGLDAIAAGADIVLVAGVEVQTTKAPVRVLILASSTLLSSKRNRTRSPFRQCLPVA